MSNKGTEFTSPVGRLVWGSLYKAITTDYDGKPLVVKSGVDAGKPTQRYDFGVAFPKTKAHFAHEPEWGELFWKTAHAAFPNNPDLARPLEISDFSWKIQDGDSTAISSKARVKTRPCDREGYAGHWVVTFSSSFAPKIYDARDVSRAVILDAPDAIVPGYAVQVIGTVRGNTGATPGLYVNHSVVGLRAYMPEIRTGGVDVTGKFGGALPTGATTVPAAGFTPAPAAPAAPPVPPAPPAVVPAAPVAVTPAPSLVGIPPVAVAPPTPASAPPPMPPAVGRPPHKGIPFDSYIAAGWTIDQLRADGYVG